MGTSLFISYSWRDKARVQEHVRVLQDRGWNVYLDEQRNRAGSDLHATLHEALADAGSVVVFVGAGGLGQIQRNEVIVAMYRRDVDGITVVPVLIGGESIPDEMRSLIGVGAALDGVNEVVDAIERALDDASAVKSVADGDDGGAGRPEAPSAGDAERDGGDEPGVRPEPKDAGGAVRDGGDEPGARPEPTAAGAATPTEAEPTEPAEPAVAPSAEELGLRSAADVLDSLERDLQQAPPAFILGSRYPEGESGSPPSRSQFARSMLVKLGVVDPDYSELLPSFDRAGAYFAFAQATDFRELEQFIGSPLSEQQSIVPSPFQVTAKIANVWTTRQQESKYDQRPVVIVTTNHDTLFERALAREGCAFTRFVQRHDPIGAVVSAYGPAKLREAADLSPRDFEKFLRGGAEPMEAAEARALPLCDAERPETYVLVVKYHGSHDIPASCALSSPQLHRLAKHNCVPDIATSTLQYAPIVISGYRLVDGELHHLWATWIEDVVKASRLERVLVQPKLEEDDSDSVQARIEAPIREGLLKNCQRLFHISPVIADPAAFLEEIRVRSEGLDER